LRISQADFLQSALFPDMVFFNTMRLHGPVLMHFLRLSGIAPAFVILMATLSISARGDMLPQERLLLDFGWKFHLGDEWGLAEQLDKGGVSLGPAAAFFADGKGRTVNLTLDWVIDLQFDEKEDTSLGL
jgi:hypothetical protein